jgi:hypothetical protein
MHSTTSISGIRSELNDAAPSPIRANSSTIVALT